MVKEIRRVLSFIFSIEFLRMGIFWTLSLLISHLRLFNGRLCARYSFTYSRQLVASNSTAKRPICIITGATSGLGAATAHALAKEGFLVVLVGRSGHLLTKAMSEIKKLNEDAQLEAFEVDLSSFSSIMKFKGSFQQWLLDMNLHSSIQLLVNNAGILATSFRETAYGFDEMMMTNYMGAFCLTKALLPLLMESPLPSRIVNLSSFTHRNGR
uniref:Uncharacterized protein n=1 Tax=Opuntia streptacantha TaxID=393608 RepID=A0A7C9F9H9_OPUST